MKNKLSFHLLDDVASNAGEPLIQSLVEKGKSCMVEAHQIKNRGVEIRDVARRFNGPKAQFIRCTDGLAPFHSGASQPHAEAIRIVIAARFADAFAGWGAAKFSAPDQKCFVPQSRSLQIRHQGGDGLIGFTSVKFVVVDAVRCAHPKCLRCGRLRSKAE